jgi:hypothetical protein
MAVEVTLEVLFSSGAFQVRFDGFRHRSDLGHRGLQLFGGDAELLRPMSDLVVFSNATPSR